MSKRRVFTWPCGETFAVRKKPGDPTRIQYRTPAEGWAPGERGWRSGKTIDKLERFLAGEASYGHCDGPHLEFDDNRLTPNGQCMVRWPQEKIKVLTDVYRYVRRIRS